MEEIHSGMISTGEYWHSMVEYFCLERQKSEA